MARTPNASKSRAQKPPKQRGKSAEKAKRQVIPIILVVGSHDNEEGEKHKAKCETVAALLVKHGVHLLTGGGPGVMAKVGQFFVEHPEREAGQRCLGVLPCDESNSSVAKKGYPNCWVEIPIFTHLSGKKKLPGKQKSIDTPKEANSRNHINALTASAVIGLPGGDGTLAELELAVAYERPCVTFLDSEDQIKGLSESQFRTRISNVSEAELDQFLKAILKPTKV